MSKRIIIKHECEDDEDAVQYLEMVAELIENGYLGGEDWSLDDVEEKD